MNDWLIYFYVGLALTLLIILLLQIPDFKIRFFDGKLGVEYMSDGVFKKAIHLVVVSIWIYK